MPHLLLEYSAEIAPAAGLSAVFAQLHTALAQIEGFPLPSLKSRAIAHAHTRVGEGLPDSHFVHVTLSLLEGRALSMRQRLVTACRQVLQQHFAAPTQAAPALQLSVEIREMRADTYFKS